MEPEIPTDNRIHAIWILDIVLLLVFLGISELTQNELLLEMRLPIVILTLIIPGGWIGCQLNGDEWEESAQRSAKK